MKNFRIILLLHFSSISFQSIAQSDEEVQPTNMDKHLEVVREGRSKEKAENQKRETELLSNRDRQQVLLNEELAELARQEEIADRFKLDSPELHNLGDPLNKDLKDRIKELEEEDDGEGDVVVRR